ncbi:hypothetical protein CBLAS_0729 [Campylobacter blaseri]|uniref:Uncharacterized protein n=1 Tax=Campylobacter blaseri TaxID=2042961 RepID=A0A2P8R2A4_9BACT|nr:hypothetical protein [Campylobacter blaseri]PSM52619.1 hypothetical protein CQ405_02500 [Campylobacter blaseri]PSM54267.1 hypothetical protein CRN67_02500 [Campylobacter blaseri]QKF85918.1 hypothetical protein CBLAS_0729 [Campylobacter blaseri]
MKIAVECECIIMQKTLEIFLKDFLVNHENADFIVSDIKKNLSKDTFLISNDSPYMNLPFNKNQLIVALEEYNFMLNYKKEEVMRGNIEDKISTLCDEFKKSLIKIVKEHYE